MNMNMDADEKSKFTSPVKSKKKNNNQAQTQGGGQGDSECIKYTSTFFIGLSFLSGLRHIDIGSSLSVSIEYFIFHIACNM